MVVVPARSKKLPPLERQAQPHTRADPRPAPSPATGPSTIVTLVGEVGAQVQQRLARRGRRGEGGRKALARPGRPLVGSGVKRFAIYRPDGMALPASAVMDVARDDGGSWPGDANRRWPGSKLAWRRPRRHGRACQRSFPLHAHGRAAKDVFRARGRRPLSRPSFGSGLAEGSACFARTHAHAPSHHPSHPTRRRWPPPHTFSSSLGPTTEGSRAFEITVWLVQLLAA